MILMCLEVFDNNYKLIKSEIENCFRTTILKGQWGRGAGRMGLGNRLKGSRGLGVII